MSLSLSQQKQTIMKALEVLLKTTTNGFDTRKVLNRSSVTIPSDVIENLEDGVFTTEMIDKLAETLPVFRYQTCITIHGAWNHIGNRRIGGYANVIQNKNGSVEVRYSAIDTEKVKKINEMFRAAGKGCRINTTSSDRAIQFSKTVNKENYQSVLEAYNAIAKRISEVNFYGTVQIYTAAAWGVTYLVLEISPLAIPETSVNDFVLAVLGTSRAEYDALVEAQNIENAKREAEFAQAAQVREQRALKIKEAIAETEKQILHLRECTDPTRGTLVKASNSNSAEINPIFVFYRATKGSFGRLKIDKAISQTFTQDLQWQEFKQIKPAEFEMFSKGCRLVQ